MSPVTVSITTAAALSPSNSFMAACCNSASIVSVRVLPCTGGVAWSAEALRGFDAALVATDHDGVDYAALVANAPLVVDTRDVCARLGLSGPNVVTA